MVAELEKPSVGRKNTQKGRMVGKIDLLTRSHCRNLYVVKQLSAPEVATQTGLTPRQIYDLADREGWTKTRAEMKRKCSEALRLREEADIGEMVDAVAIKSSVLSLGSLDAGISELAKPGTDRDKARNLQAYAQAAKVYVGLYRQAKQLDQANDAASSSQINVMFVGSLPRSAERITRNVTPATEPAKPASEQPAIDVASSATQAT